jgi:hypothetical protein
MENNVTIKRKAYQRETYRNVIDTKFKQLVPPSSAAKILNTLTVDDFFTLYNTLFYEIPKFGTTNSHEFLINQSTNYIGAEQNSEDIAALLEEINSLRQQLLDANQKILELSTQTNG